jgi:8-oxo-dGTP pyrophosphatase MutT (NUDIX family)
MVTKQIEVYNKFMKKGVDYTGITIVYFCHDGHGNYLFSKRGKNCRDEQGTWDQGGGGLEFGDTVENTLRKEIKEEYCTDVLNYEFLGYLDVHRENEGVKTHWLALDFKVLVDRDKVKNGEPHKFDEIGWFKLNNLPTPLHSQTPKRFEMYKEKL